MRRVCNEAKRGKRNSKNKLGDDREEKGDEVELRTAAES